MRRENMERFRREAEKGEVLEVPNASHNIIQTHPREVLEAIEEFAARRAAER